MSLWRERLTWGVTGFLFGASAVVALWELFS